MKKSILIVIVSSFLLSIAQAKSSLDKFSGEYVFDSENCRGEWVTIGNLIIKYNLEDESLSLIDPKKQKQGRPTLSIQYSDIKDLNGDYHETERSKVLRGKKGYVAKSSVKSSLLDGNQIEQLIKYEYLVDGLEEFHRKKANKRISGDFENTKKRSQLKYDIEKKGNQLRVEMTTKRVFSMENNDLVVTLNTASGLVQKDFNHQVPMSLISTGDMKKGEHTVDFLADKLVVERGDNDFAVFHQMVGQCKLKRKN